MKKTRLADLYLLGIGIKGMSQISLETQEILKRCRLVFHLSYSHDELRALNSNLVDLADEYWTEESHDLVYDRLVARIMKEVARGPGVASVTYGHPLFFDDVHMELTRICRRKKLNCVVLPAISSLDTLSVDLGVDYGEGLQVFEAVDLVEGKLKINPQLHTLVFQIGEYGMQTTSYIPSEEPKRFIKIQKYLMRYFPADHPIVVAMSDNGDGRTLLKSRLGRLNSHRRRIGLGSTLYLAPLPR